MDSNGFDLERACRKSLFSKSSNIDLNLIQFNNCFIMKITVLRFRVSGRNKTYLNCFVGSDSKSERSNFERAHFAIKNLF